MLVEVLAQLQSKRMDFVSYTQNIDTSTPIGKAMFTMVSAFAEFEKSLIVERVKAGMQVAKSRGIHVGRPSLSDDIRDRAQAMRKAGLSIRKIANELSISVGMVHKLSMLDALDNSI